MKRHARSRCALLAAALLAWRWRRWLRAARTPHAGASAPAQLTGTLAKVRDSRHASPSATANRRSRSRTCRARSEPIGYSIELCRALVDGDRARRWTRASRSSGVPVTSESRIDAVVTGQVDLECGSTTSNLERQKRVAFSPTMFVSGTKLMVKKGSPIKSFRDLAGKTVAVTARHHQREDDARPGRASSSST